MTGETGLAAALRERYMTAYETGEPGPPSWDENARVALAWVDARLADPATVEAVEASLRAHWQFWGGCRCGWQPQGPPEDAPDQLRAHLADAALAVVRGLLGGTGGDLFERNLRVLKHEAETPMRGHDATCCLRAALGEDA